jgi:hypothetical protein
VVRVRACFCPSSAPDWGPSSGRDLSRPVAARFHVSAQIPLVMKPAFTLASAAGAAIRAAGCKAVGIPTTRSRPTQSG